MYEMTNTKVTRRTVVEGQDTVAIDMTQPESERGVWTEGGGCDIVDGRAEGREIQEG